nr:MAG TPA: hypothetical protein [Caudoviricetes sp.]
MNISKLKSHLMQPKSGHPDNSVKRKANGFPFFV